jgi:hypothetical protein
MLCSAIDGEFVSTFGEYSRQAASLLGFVEHMAWALMRPGWNPVSHPAQRATIAILYALRLQYTCGCPSLAFRRLSPTAPLHIPILRSLLLPRDVLSTFDFRYHSEQHVWAIMKSRHSPEDEAELRDRAHSWDLTLRSAVRFRF